MFIACHPEGNVYHLPAMTEPVQQPAAQLPLYSTQGIVVGTILGSLAAGVVMLFLNYRALGRDALARTIGAWGGGIFVVVVVIASLVPGTPVFGLLFMVIQAGIAYFLTERLQGEAIRYHQAHAGPMHSTLRAAGVGFLTGMVLMFAMLSFLTLIAAFSGGGVPGGAAGAR
jgi:hypothetical protein